MAGIFSVEYGLEQIRRDEERAVEEATATVQDEE